MALFCAAAPFSGEEVEGARRSARRRRSPLGQPWHRTRGAPRARFPVRGRRLPRRRFHGKRAWARGTPRRTPRRRGRRAWRGGGGYARFSFNFSCVESGGIFLSAGGVGRGAEGGGRVARRRLRTRRAFETRPDELGASRRRSSGPGVRITATFFPRCGDPEPRQTPTLRAATRCGPSVQIFRAEVAGAESDRRVRTIIHIFVNIFGSHAERGIGATRCLLKNFRDSSQLASSCDAIRVSTNDSG